MLGGTWGLEVSRELYCLSQAVGLFLIWMKQLSVATCFCCEIGPIYFCQLCEVPVRDKYELQSQMGITETPSVEASSAPEPFMQKLNQGHLGATRGGCK